MPEPASRFSAAMPDNDAPRPLRSMANGGREDCHTKDAVWLILQYYQNDSLVGSASPMAFASRAFNVESNADLIWETDHERLKQGARLDTKCSSNRAEFDYVDAPLTPFKI